jgi:hypothetical protein
MRRILIVGNSGGGKPTRLRSDREIAAFLAAA